LSKIIIAFFIVAIILMTCYCAWAENSCCLKWKIGPNHGHYTAWTNGGTRQQYKIEHCPECGEPLYYSRAVEIIHNDSLLLGIVLVKKDSPIAENYWFPHPKRITDTLWKKLCDLTEKE